MENKPIEFIRELMKAKTVEEILAAEENFRDYLLLIKQMADRIENENNPDIAEDFSQES